METGANTVPGGRGGRGHARRVAAVAMLAVALAACGGSDGGGSSGPTATTGATGATPSVIQRPESSGTLTIVSPKNGAVVEGASVDLRVDLEGAKIVPQTTTDVRPDEGHLHVLLDGELISMTEGTEQTIGGLTPGLHRVQVEFVAADHAPFDPRVVAVVAFEVQG